MHTSPSTYHRRVIICLFVCLLHWAGCSLHVRSNITYYLPVTKHYLPVTSTKPSILVYWLSEQANVLTINISIWWIRRLPFRVTKWLIQATEIIQVGKWLKGHTNPSLSDFRESYFLLPQAKVEPSHRERPWIACGRMAMGEKTFIHPCLKLKTSEQWKRKWPFHVWRQYRVGWNGSIGVGRVFHCFSWQLLRWLFLFNGRVGLLFSFVLSYLSHHSFFSSWFRSPGDNAIQGSAKQPRGHGWQHRCWSSCQSSSPAPFQAGNTGQIIQPLLSELPRLGNKLFTIGPTDCYRTKRVNTCQLLNTGSGTWYELNEDWPWPCP